MKLKDLTLEDFKEYLGVTDAESNYSVRTCRDAVTAFIRSYTGLSDDEINENEDITIAALTIANEMFNNRDYTVNSGNLNPLVRQILAMHSVNLL